MRVVFEKTQGFIGLKILDQRRLFVDPRASLSSTRASDCILERRLYSFDQRILRRRKFSFLSITCSAVNCNSRRIADKRLSVESPSIIDRLPGIGPSPVRYKRLRQPRALSNMIPRKARHPWIQLISRSCNRSAFFDREDLGVDRDNPPNVPE